MGISVQYSAECAQAPVTLSEEGINSFIPEIQMADVTEESITVSWARLLV